MYFFLENVGGGCTGYIYLAPKSTYDFELILPLSKMEKDSQLQSSYSLFRESLKTSETPKKLLRDS